MMTMRSSVLLSLIVVALLGGVAPSKAQSSAADVSRKDRNQLLHSRSGIV